MARQLEPETITDILIALPAERRMRQIQQTVAQSHSLVYASKSVDESYFSGWGVDD